MVLLPLYDDDPLEGKTTPYVTYVLIAANLIVAFLTLTLPEATYNALLNAIGLVPAREIRELPSLGLFPRDLALVTSMFLHAGWEHLLFNMLFLWIFGDNIEDAIGHLRFFFFYFLCGLAGGAAYVISALHDTMPVIGASGAIAGVMAAYLMIRPCASIKVLVFLMTKSVPAYTMIGLWMAVQLFYVQLHENDGVGYWAHIGGAIAGALLILVMRPRHVELFECMSPADVPGRGGTTTLE